MYENVHIETVAVDFSRRQERSLDEMCWTIKRQDKAISESVVIEAVL